MPDNKSDLICITDDVIMSFLPDKVFSPFCLLDKQTLFHCQIVLPFLPDRGVHVFVIDN